MADISKTVAIIFEGQDSTSPAIAKIEAGLRGIDTEAKSASTGLQKIENSAAGLEKSSAGAQALARAIQGLAIAAIVQEFISANVAAERFQKTMEAAGNSSQQAADQFDYVKGVANRFGVELVDTADAYAKFSAAAKGTALEGDGARLVFEAFVGTMSRLGLSSADVSGALVQLGQGVSKGKFELDDLKSIAERIPGFFSEFAKSMGVSTTELYDLISAGKIGSRELLVFSDTLRNNFKGTEFDGFTASAARMKTAISEAYIELGKSGVFDGITKVVQLATGYIVAFSASMELIADRYRIIRDAISTGDFSNFGEKWEAAMTKAKASTKDAAEALLGVAKQAGTAGGAADDAGRKIAEGMGKGAVSTKDMERAAGEVDKALKSLGLDPKKFVDPVETVKKAFADLASNPAVKGDQLLAGLMAALDKLKAGKDVDSIGDQLEAAFKRGAISAQQYGAGLDAIRSKQDGTWRGMATGTDIAKANADALERQAKEAEKAAEAAAKMKLELEKLASNERIKLIEARVTLNVAQIQADTERVKAAFSSIDGTIKSTGDVISSIFGSGVLKEGISGVDVRFQLIQKQLDMENQRRDQALRLQQEMTRAQIEEMRARTQALLGGDALIKIDGAGLKPHLEAFMWEILRTIQTRVNKDGLKMLLGT